jgi:ACS family glucarate transporter-like MFS transporter
VNLWHAVLHRIRWRIFSLVFGFGCIAYLQQKSVTVAAARMMPELGFSQVQIGWLEWAFLLGYAVFQLPGGVFGQRLGARVTYVVIGLVAFLATALTPLAPLALSGASLFVAVFGLQLLLGSAQGPVFPVSAGVVETWFRPEQWALVLGVQSMGLQFAAALAPPLVATIMTFFGWQQALFWPALPALALIAFWAWYARDTPAEHRAVTAAELAELGDEGSPRVESISWTRLVVLCRNRSIVLLTLSYACMNYVYYLIGNWCFLYLVEERHFTILESGWLAAAPPLAAAVGAGVGGQLAGFLCMRFGIRWGFRLVPLVALPAAGALLLLGVFAASPYMATAALAACFAAVELTEGPYWAATMYVARSDSMSATGILNTGGNVGGLIGIPIVAYLSGHGAWIAAFAIGTAFALTSAAAWLGVDTTRPAAEPPSAEELAAQALAAVRSA